MQFLKMMKEKNKRKKASWDFSHNHVNPEAEARRYTPLKSCKSALPCRYNESQVILFLQYNCQMVLLPLALMSFFQAGVAFSGLNHILNEAGTR